MVLASYVFVLVNAISMLGSSQQMSAARSLTLILRTHNLLVDMRNRRLIEADTFSGIPCYVSAVTPTNLALVGPSSNKFRKLLNEFPNLLKPTFSIAEVKNGVHNFIATKDRPVFARARRLAPDRLAKAKKEFSVMEKMGIIRKSSSPWASPLHMVS